mgnify:FL=1
MKPGRELSLTRWLFQEQPAVSVVPSEPDWALDALELIKQGMVVIDAKGLVRKINHSACKILGFDSAELLGQSCMLVAPPEIQLDGDRFMAGLLRQSQKIKSHWVMRHKSGAYLTVTAEFKTLHSAAFGASVLIVFAIDDKTDPVAVARRAQNERDASHMALSYGMLHQVINSIPAHIAYFDSKTLQCIFGNEAFAQGHAQHVKTLHGKTLQDLLLPAAWAALKPHFEIAARGQFVKFYHTTSDLLGETQHFQCDLLPHFARSGEQIGIFALSVDITAHHQTELALRDSESRLHKALKTEKELGELKTVFVAMASHELRTPLTTIQSATDLLMHYGTKLSEPEREDSLTEIQSAVQRMVSIMENILVLGKIGQSGSDADVPVDIQLFLEEITQETMRAYPRIAPIQIQPLHPNCTLLLQESSLRHVLGNLLSNACKYSAPDQAVTLVWQKLTSGPSPCLSIAITDHGIGIPPEHMPRLFESFRRAANVGKIPGTGLGMPIAKRAIDSMGGSITVSSSPEAGTCFTVCLPWRI